MLRPLNMVEGTFRERHDAGNKCRRLRLTVVNIMTNLFMAANDPVFTALNDAGRNKLARDAEFILVDVHGEATSEKMALGHYADGRASLVVGTFYPCSRPIYEYRPAGQLPNRCWHVW